LRNNLFCAKQFPFERVSRGASILAPDLHRSIRDFLSHIKRRTSLLREPMVTDKQNQS